MQSIFVWMSLFYDTGPISMTMLDIIKRSSVVNLSF